MSDTDPAAQFANFPAWYGTRDAAFKAVDEISLSDHATMRAFLEAYALHMHQTQPQNRRVLTMEDARQFAKACIADAALLPSQGLPNQVFEAWEAALGPLPNTPSWQRLAARRMAEDDGDDDS